MRCLEHRASSRIFVNGYLPHRTKLRPFCADSTLHDNPLTGAENMTWHVYEIENPASDFGGMFNLSEFERLWCKWLVWPRCFL